MSTQVKSRSGGFTLAELVVVLAIAAILAAIAYPSFVAPLLRARRSDGIVALMQLQGQQERWRAEHGEYASQSELNFSTTSAGSHYVLAVSGATATGYELLATATGTQAADLACKVLRLAVIEGSTIQSGGPDAAASIDSTDSQRCWNR